MLSFSQKILHYLLFYFIIFLVNERVHYFLTIFFVYFCNFFEFLTLYSVKATIITKTKIASILYVFPLTAPREPQTMLTHNLRTPSAELPQRGEPKDSLSTRSKMRWFSHRIFAFCKFAPCKLQNQLDMVFDTNS